MFEIDRLLKRAVLEAVTGLQLNAGAASNTRAWNLRNVFAERKSTHGIVASCHRFRHTTGTKLANAALRGAEATRNMMPLKGRSSYIGERALGHVDPGAFAIGVWTKAIASALEK
ncbi:DAK2 domain-containing protein [Cupriavidus sp. PET2-C1]